jgi:glyoxylase-like metal-dependent hydrolase (beta-lactamase superfamily II)
MGVKKIDEHLSYIDIFDTISPWVYKDENLCFLVDPGPMIYINPLKNGLRKLKIGENDLDYILLTHIHIDHAGSVGELIESYPQARVVCHLNGIEHLVNPEKLWKKSVKVLGIP